jgi:glycosyltransferase involved in cell wall biosynthesis
MNLRPDVVHCHDLDTLYAGWRLKKATGAAILFDAHENYPASMSLYLPRLLVGVLCRWEQWLIQKVDAVITASTVLRDEYLARGLSPVLNLGNYADAERFRPLPDTDVRQARQKLGVPDDALLVSYIGGFHRNRAILPFLEAAGSSPDIHVAIWGDGDQAHALEVAAAGHPNVHCHGWADPNELPLCFQMSDVIYYGLRLDYPGAKYNAPNTLSQAMMMSRPLIATNVGDLGRIVEMTGCGILIEDTSPETIGAAIEALRSPEKRRALGEKGRAAALEAYNADALRDRLVELYATVTQ